MATGAINFEALKRSVSLQRVVSAFIPLKKVGRNLVGSCPLHHDKTPSLTVFPDEHFHCFSCHWQGDALDFIQKVEGVDLKGALKILEDEFDADIETGDALRTIRLRESCWKWYEGQIETLSKAQDIYDQFLLYLDREKLIDDWFVANTDSIRLGELKESITAISGDEIFAYYETGRGEPLPHFNGIRLRMLRPALGWWGTRKHHNYSQRLKSDVRREMCSLLAESGQAEFDRALDSVSSALLQYDEYGPDRPADVVLSLDSDAAGQKATYGSGKMLRKGGLAVSVAAFDEKDPDEQVSRHGRDSLSDCYSKSVDYLVWLVRYIKRSRDDLGGEGGRAEAVREVIDAIRCYPSEEDTRKEVDRLALLIGDSKCRNKKSSRTSKKR